MWSYDNIKAMDNKNGSMDNKNRLNLLFENKFMHAALFAVFNLLNLLSL